MMLAMLAFSQRMSDEIRVFFPSEDYKMNEMNITKTSETLRLMFIDHV